jgi:putative membrane protein
VFGGELGAAYLGTQGDPWDAHRDMALAGLGALMAAAVALLTWVRERRVAAD